MQIGPYRVLDELARGGMGVVYRALGPDGSHVALKLLSVDKGAGSTIRERFAREAHTLGRLRHPGVVSILDAGLHAGAPWIALTYVPGPSLGERLRQGPLPLEEALGYGRDLASALSYVHACGVLHRDLKPDNVLLSDGRALLTDFGLALDAADGLRLTTSGVLMGTPGYWPPEQVGVHRAALGPASDVYGLGAVLYACLTGRAPRTGSTIQELASLDASRPILAPRAVRPEVPGWLDALVLRCLATDPERRPRSAAAVGLALERGADGGAVPRWALPLGLAGVLGAAACALVWSVTPEAQVEPPAPVAPPAADAAPADAQAEPRPEATAGDLQGAQAAFARGNALRRQWRMEEAIQEYDRALEVAPGAVGVLVNRGIALRFSERYEEALRDFDRALEVDPDAVLAHLQRGITLGELARWKEALEALQRARRGSPRNVDALHFWLGRATDELGDVRAAIPHYAEAARLRPREAEPALRLGIAHCRLGQAAPGYEALSAVLELEPRHAEARFFRGNCLAGLNRPREAIEDFTVAIEGAPRHVDAYSNRGVQWRRVGEPARALADYERALSFAPDSPLPRLNRANVLCDLGRFAEAEDEYRALLRREQLPEGMRPKLERGLERALARGR